MKRITWGWVLAAVFWTGGAAAWATSSPAESYEKIEATSLVRSPQNSWARAILFTDVLKALPEGRLQRLDRKNYQSMHLETVGTVWVPESEAPKFQKLTPGGTYSFAGTVDQISRRYYVIVDACYVIQTAEDMKEHWIDMLNPETAAAVRQTDVSDTAMQKLLVEAQNSLIKLAQDSNTTVAELIAGQTDGGQRIAEHIVTDALQGELRAQNKTAEQLMIDAVLALLQKQSVLQESAKVGEANAALIAAQAPAEVALPPASVAAPAEEVEGAVPAEVPAVAAEAEQPLAVPEAEAIAESASAAIAEQPELAPAVEVAEEVPEVVAPVQAVEGAVPAEVPAVAAEAEQPLAVPEAEAMIEPELETLAESVEVVPVATPAEVATAGMASVTTTETETMAPEVAEDMSMASPDEAPATTTVPEAPIPVEPELAVLPSAEEISVVEGPMDESQEGSPRAIEFPPGQTQEELMQAEEKIAKVAEPAGEGVGEEPSSSSRLVVPLTEQPPAILPLVSVEPTKNELALQKRQQRAAQREAAAAAKKAQKEERAHRLEAERQADLEMKKTAAAEKKAKAEMLKAQRRQEQEQAARTKREELERRQAELAMAREVAARDAEQNTRLAEEKRRAQEVAQLAEEKSRLEQEKIRLAEERRKTEEAMRLAKEKERVKQEKAALAEEKKRLAQERRDAAEATRRAEAQRRAEAKAQRAAAAAEAKAVEPPHVPDESGELPEWMQPVPY